MKLIDMTGLRFGRYTVICRSRGPRKNTSWTVRCDCGTVRDVEGSSLRRGVSTSCGCYRAEFVKRLGKSRRIELAGQKFGRLLVVGRDDADVGDRGGRWICACDCGARTTACGRDLKSGGTKSCGCLVRDRNRQTKKKVSVTYSSAHGRVRRLRGSAARWICVDCSGPAKDWSYRGGDPDEQLELVLGYWLAYSLNPDYYEARCRKCHFRHDRGVAA